MRSIRRPVWLSDVIGSMAFAAVVRVAYLTLVESNWVAQSDAYQYQDIAQNASAGNGIAMQWPQLEVHPTAFRPPLYPWLLSLWIRLFGDNPDILRLLNLLLGVVLVGLVMWMVRSLGGRRAGWTAAGLVAIYPPLVANDVTTLADPLALVLLTLVFALIVRRRWFWAGAVGGLLALTKPSAQGLAIIIAVVAIAAAWQIRHEVAETSADLSDVRPLTTSRWALTAARHAGLALVAFGLVIAPWVVRNRVELGTATLVTSNGFNLAAVYSERSRATNDWIDPVYDPQRQSLADRLLRLDEAEWNRSLSAEGLSGIRREPSYVAKVVWRNALNWFELTPSKNNGAERLDGRNLTVRGVGLPLFYLVTVLGTIGLVDAWRNSTTRTMAIAMALTAAYFSAASLVTVSVPRLRGPVDLMCCITVGLLAPKLIDRWGPVRFQHGHRLSGSG